MNNTLPLSPIAMIIEDDEKLARIFTAAISEAGFTPHIVHRGDEALQELSVFQPRLVILDLNLPGIPGEVILKAIHEDPQLTKTRVIVATADAERARVMEEEGDLVLVKPVSFSQLRDLSYRLVKTRL